MPPQRYVLPSKYDQIPARSSKAAIHQSICPTTSAESVEMVRQSKTGNYHTAPRATAPSSISARPCRRCSRKTTVPFRFRRPTSTIPATHATERQTGAKQRTIRFPAYTGAPFIRHRKNISANHILYILPPVCRASYPLFECRLLLPCCQTFKSSLHLQNMHNAAIFSADQAPCFSARLQLFRPRPFPTSPLCRPLPSLI